jgi:hypothetical protein
MFFRLGLRTFLIGLLAIPSTTASGQWPDGGPDMTIDAKAKGEAIDSLVKELNEAYVYPDVGDKVAKTIEERQAHGEYNSVNGAKEFSDLLNKQMFAVAHDQHLHVLYSSRAIPPTPATVPQQPSPQMLLQFKKDNYSFQEVKRLDGNIGYLKMSAFSEAESGGATVAAAMAFLANTDAMIIDLRENSGGYPAMVALLASYFSAGNLPYTSMIWSGARKELGNIPSPSGGCCHMCPARDTWVRKFMS